MGNNRLEMTKADEYFLANIGNMVNFAKFKHMTKFTAFLDERQQALACGRLKKLSFTDYALYGGNDSSERKMLGVFDAFGKVENADFPITAINVKFNANASITHRDCLGAIMGLQINRDCIGDIIIAQDCVTIFCTDDIKTFVLSNLDKIGKFPVTLSVSANNEIEKKQEFVKISGTVSSMRLDCIVSLITNKSRSLSAQIIGSKLVKVNYFEADSVSIIIRPNDVISIRGYGKFIVLDDMKITKKDRLFIGINKFV